MANLPAPIFRPLSGRRSIFYNQQPLRSGFSGTPPTPQQGFSDASETVAVYQYEGTFLLFDSIGSNDLTNNGAVGVSASDVKEASFSATFDGSSYLSIADAQQSSRYPLKNGESNTKFTITSWFKLTDVSGTKVLWGKGTDISPAMQFAILSNGNLGYRVHTGVIFEDIDFGASLTANVWYHHGLEADHDTKTYRLTLWNDSTSSETIVLASGTINVPTPPAPWSIGANGSGSNPITGLMDEYSVNDRLLGIPDIRQIREGVYDGPLSVRATSFGVQTLGVSPEASLRATQFGVQVLITNPIGIARATQFGVQVLHLPLPLAIKVFPLIPPERVFESQTGKRVFPLP